MEYLMLSQGMYGEMAICCHLTSPMVLNKPGYMILIPPSNTLPQITSLKLPTPLLLAILNPLYHIYMTSNLFHVNTYAASNSDLPHPPHSCTKVPAHASVLQGLA